MHEVIAAIATEPDRIVACRPSDLERTGGVGPRVGAAVVADAGRRGRSIAGCLGVDATDSTAALGSTAGRIVVGHRRPFGKFDRKFSRARQRHPVLRPPRPGHGRHDGREVELEQRVELRPVRPARATGPAPWRSARRGRPARPAGRSGAGRRGSRRRSGRASTSPRTRGSCSRSSPGRRAPGSARPSPANSTNAPTTPNARSISVTTSTRSVAVEPRGSSPERRTPTIRGIGW